MSRSTGPFDSDDALFAPIGEHSADSAPMQPMQGARSPLDNEYARSRVPDNELDRYFDAELGFDEATELFEKLSRRSDKAEDVVWTQRAIEALQRPLQTPNLVPSILREVDRRRAWLSPLGLLKVNAFRYAAGVAILAVVGAGYAMQRFAPEVTSVAPQQAHIGAIVEASVVTAEAVENLPCAIEEVCCGLGLDTGSESELQVTTSCPLPRTMVVAFSGTTGATPVVASPLERRERAADAIEIIAGTGAEPLFLPETLDGGWASDREMPHQQHTRFSIAHDQGLWASSQPGASQGRMIFVGASLAPDSLGAVPRDRQANPFRDRR